MVAAMTEDRRNLLARRDIVAAYVAVAARPDEFIRICSTVPGGRDEVRAAVQEAFGLDVIPADAVMSMQLRRLSPFERQRTRDELAELEARIARSDD